MFKVTFSFEDGSVVEHFANAGDNLLELAREANVAIDAPCSGNASCGKCRVQLKKGELDSKKTLHDSPLAPLLMVLSVTSAQYGIFTVLIAFRMLVS